MDDLVRWKNADDDISDHIGKDGFAFGSKLDTCKVKEPLAVEVHVRFRQLAQHKLDFLLDFELQKVSNVQVRLLGLRPAVLEHVQQDTLARNFFSQFGLNWVQDFVLCYILENTDKLAANFDTFNLLLLPNTKTKVQLGITELFNLTLTLAIMLLCLA